MKILSENGRILTFVGLGADKDTQILGKRISRQLVAAAFGSTLFLAVVFAGLLLLGKHSDGPAALIFPVILLLTCLSLLLTYISLIVKRNQMWELFGYLQHLVDEKIRVSNKSTVNIYQQSDAFIGKITRFAFLYGQLTVVLPHMVPVMCPLLYSTVGFPEPDFWFTPCSYQEATLPFDTRTIVGFLTVTMVNLICAVAIVLLYVVFATYYVAVCTFVKSCVENISMVIVDSNATIDGKMSIQDELKQIIELHGNCYSIMHMLEDIIQAPIFFQFSIFGLQIAMFLFEIENNINEFSFNLAFDMSTGVFYLIVNFVLSYFITTLTINAMSVGDKIYDLLWYQLLPKEKFIVQTIIRRSQDPFELKGLGVFVCSLETYLKYIRSAVSYYMLFRQLQTNF